MMNVLSVSVDFRITCSGIRKEGVCLCDMKIGKLLSEKVNLELILKRGGKFFSTVKNLENIPSRNSSCTKA